MKKIGRMILIIFLILIIFVIAFLIYQFGFKVKRYETGAEKIGDCGNLDLKATDFGKVGVEISSKSNQSVEGVEMNLAKTVGANTYCSAITGRNGLSLFDKVPVGEWCVYNRNLPERLGGGGPPHCLSITVSKGITSEAGALLK